MTLRKLIASGALAAVLVTGLPVLAPQAAMAQTQIQSFQCGASVRVRPGDTLFGIARRCGVTVNQILRHNPQITSVNHIRAGTTLRLAPSRQPAPPPPVSPVATHVVRLGETVASISRLHGVSIGAIVAANPNLSNPNAIWPGMRLTIPRAGTVPPRPQPPQPQPQPERVLVEGRLTGEGATCQAMRGSDGRLYTLSGNLRWFHTGDYVQVRGRIAEMSTCQQGTTIEIERIDASRP